jgi:N-succinyldiaminopimelate aminotransferase
MNPNLQKLHPYPFERLTQLKLDAEPPAELSPIVLSIGEPRHPTPHFISEALIAHLHGLNEYPATRGKPELRQAIAAWLSRRFQIPAERIDAERHILPVSGTREALFSLAQCLIDPTHPATVMMPNPFYQIYEGAAILAGAKPYFLNTTRESAYLPDFDAVPEAVWESCQLLYICSPGNPSGAVIDLESMESLIALADRYHFVIASDECYSELYFDESLPPPGLLQAADTMGNDSFKNCIVFHSLSKRSNAPGLRSGFVAGDADLLQRYFLYRTYQGCAMPLQTQFASLRAWQDEAHVRQNRARYREKFVAVMKVFADVHELAMPQAGFYLWLPTPIDDADFALQLYTQHNVTVLPGSFLSRDFKGINPGRNHVRIALVQPSAECVEAAHRIKALLAAL